MDAPLYLLDGYSLVYRSYFAFLRNPLRNPQGENSSAVFGFFRTLFALFRDQQPRYFAVTMDSKTPTFRHEKYPEYKANRQETPQDLRAQIPLIEEILAALGVPMIRVNGFEADDIMATYAVRCGEQGAQARLITGDKDLLQLVNHAVSILKPGKAGLETMDRAAVFEEWGVYPEQILDLLSLTGDSSDNVPGVKGIGQKTAAKLLGEFGTLDGIYANLERAGSASMQAKLRDGRESAYLSRDLITLATDVPLPLAPEELALPALNLSAAAPLLLAQGMRGLVQELGVETNGTLSASQGTFDLADTEADIDAGPAHTGGHGSVPAAAPGTYVLVDTLDELDRWIESARAAGTVAFDSETDNIDPMLAHPIGFSLAYEEGRACYIPLVGPDGPVLPADAVRARLRRLLEDPSVRVVGQNIKYDLKVLTRWGVSVRNVAFDTMVAAWLVDTTRNTYNMDALAEHYLGYRTIHFAELFGESSASKVGDRTFAEVALDAATTYAAEDADITLRLYRLLDPLLDERGARTLFEELEMPLVPLLARIEAAGIGLDTDQLATYSVELERDLAAIEQQIYRQVGHEFNIASTKQLQEVLFVERRLQPIKKTKTGYSTDESVLQQLAREDEVPALVLRYRMLSKLRSTYVEALPRLVNPETGRLHTNLQQTGTATGRLSSTDPNLQNIPIREEEGRRIRSAFVPRAGWVFVSADYSQIELVVLAHLTGDPNLCAAFNAGEDVHRRTAALIFGVDAEAVTGDQRRIAKTINFGVMYGMSAFRLSNELGISRKQADEFIAAYFATYHGIQRFITETVREAERTGEVRTLLGRARRLPDITNRNQTVKAGAERVAVNTPIQGSAADIVKRAMLAVDARLRREALQAQLILQVHDELIVECPREEAARVKAILTEEMSNAVQLSVPLRVNVEVGEHWGALHE